MNDQVIEKSSIQKQQRVERLTVELTGLGYTTVKTEWLEALITQNQRKTLAGMQS